MNMNIKKQWGKLTHWWNQLALREQRLVAIGVSVVVLFMLYQCIWSPMQYSLDNMRKRIVSAQKTLLWMKSADNAMQANITADKNKAKPVSLVVFLSQMQQQIKVKGLQSSLSQLKQSGNASIDMQFQKVEFDKLMMLLLNVTKEYSVSVTRMSVLPADTSGYVNAEIEIQL